MHAIPAAVTVACTTGGCAAVGRRARVYIRQVAPGVVDWPDLRCVWCGGRMQFEGEGMAKITVHGGASNAREDPPTPAPAAPELAPVVEEAAVVEEPLAVEEPVDVPVEQAEAPPQETEPGAEVPAEAPAPKRRGRPRKAT